MLDTTLIFVRPATEQDEPMIRAMARGERLNPTGLDWPNFLVAENGHRLVGMVQMRKHPDGSRELGSLAVCERMRGRGIASRLIGALLAAERGPVHMITGASHARHYERWGFRRIGPDAAPAAVRFNYRVGRLAAVISLLKRRPLRRLVILERGAPGSDHPQPSRCPKRLALVAR